MANGTSTPAKKAAKTVNSSKRPAFSHLTSTAQNVFADLMSLDVTTLTGELTLKPKKDATLSEFIKNVGDELVFDKDASEVKVVGYTKVELDKDVTQFYRENLDGASQLYLDAHNETVRTSLEARSNFIRSVIKL